MDSKKKSRQALLKTTLTIMAALLMALFAMTAAIGQESTDAFYANEDWGITLTAPEGWYMQEGSPPPASDRPFAATTGVLSSRDSFYIGLWAEDDRFTTLPAIRLSAYYTSAGTVERIEGVKDKLMSGLVQKYSQSQRSYDAGGFEIVTCGSHRAAVFLLTYTQGSQEYSHWNFLLPFPMTVFQFEGISKTEDALAMKESMTEMVASFTSE